MPFPPPDRRSSGEAADPFSILELPPRFDLEPADVRRAYRRLAGPLHPDRIADPLEQADAARRVARLTAARDALLDDEARANALLVRLGGPAPEDDRSLPDDFLMEMMEVRDRLESARSSGDAAERQALEDWARDERAGYRDQIAALFAPHDASDGEPAPLPSDAASEIRQLLNAWRYIERMIEQLDPSE